MYSNCFLIKKCYIFIIVLSAFPDIGFINANLFNNLKPYE